jgi:glycosyltransferase involved in cell wall biosynthesis
LLERKGIFDLLEAIKIVSRNNKKVRLILCGEGKIEDVRKYILKLGIQDYVLTPGWVNGEQKKEILSNGYIFVLPSYIEAFPMSLLEAMAEGLPIITTSVGGVNDIIDDSIEGFVIQPGDIEMLVKKIELLLKEESLWIKMSNAALDKVSSKFSQEKTLYQLNTIYLTLIK